MFSISYFHHEERTCGFVKLVDGLLLVFHSMISSGFALETLDTSAAVGRVGEGRGGRGKAR